MMPPFSLTDDGFESQIGVNHLGHFVLIKHLNDLIKRSKSRIVTVSSCAHEGPYPDGIRYESFTSNDSYNPLYAYGQSKLANILFANELASRFNGTGVTSNSLHPGMIKTELGRYVEEQIKKSFVLTLLSPIFALFNTAMMDAGVGALTQLYVATAPELQGVTGKYFHPVARTTQPSKLAQNQTLQKELWEISEKLTRKFW
jgi:NAD(P)-dependent dehydrogenase (short-subunit alcohol dehydrogenase family)